MSPEREMGLAERLALAFGRPDEMAKLYDPEVTWHLPLSLEVEGAPFIGVDAVKGFNRRVDTRYDASTVKVEILGALQEGDFSAARFVYSAHLLPEREPYANAYNLFVRACDGRIVEVHEGLDTYALKLARRQVRPIDSAQRRSSAARGTRRPT